ncbi:MAG: A24 family peptidase [Candidatus Saccharimonas sp.]
MTILLIVVLGLLGALLGSFACAQVWRLRARQLVEDREEYRQQKSAGVQVTRSDYYQPEELSRLKMLIRPVKTDRSECLDCHHQLAWYDLMPVVSWISLRGKCRYCGVAIGATELWAEVGLGLVFVLSYLAWPHTLSSLLDIVVFALWLVACVLMSVLFIYDSKWSLLPFSINIALIAVAFIFSILGGIAYGFHLWSSIGAIVLLAGLYAFFALFRWAGYGDSILGVGLALILGRWELAFFALFLANILGCLMLVPLYLRHKLHRRLRVPFGPFMILGAIAAMLWGAWLINQFLGVGSELLISLMV